MQQPSHAGWFTRLHGLLRFLLRFVLLSYLFRPKSLTIYIANLEYGQAHIRTGHVSASFSILFVHLMGTKVEGKFPPCLEYFAAPTLLSYSSLAL